MGGRDVTAGESPGLNSDLSKSLSLSPALGTFMNSIVQKAFAQRLGGTSSEQEGSGIQNQISLPEAYRGHSLNREVDQEVRF